MPVTPWRTLITRARGASSGGRYIAALDGLRGIAVLSVFIGHFLSPYVKTGGGYGVDVFFVLSGYLITKILIARSTRGDPIWGFYFDRMTRLLPPLIIVGISLFFIPGALLTTWGATLNFIGSIFYVTNWTRAIPVIGWPNYLAHTWSLSVEEQFYLLWPLVLLLIPQARRPQIIVALAALAAAYACAASSYFPPGRVYNGSDTRAFEFLMGAALSVSNIKFPKTLAVIGLFSLLFIFLSITYWDPPIGILVGVCVLPILQAASDGAGGVATGILQRPALVYFGAISYSLYLWHWPVFYLMSNLVGDNIWYYSIIFSIISVIIAHLTTFLVDFPLMKFRKSIKEYDKKTLGVAAFLQLIIGIPVGLYIFYSGMLKISPY